MCGSNGLHHISREWHGMGNPFFYPHGALFPVFPGDSFAFSVGPGSVLWCALVPGDARPGPGRACASGPCGWQTISAVLARSGPGVRRAQPCGSGDAPRVARRRGPGRVLLALLVAGPSLVMFPTAGGRRRPEVR